MTVTTINFELDNGDPTALSGVQLNDALGTFGVKRTDNNAVVVAAGTAMIDDGGGKFHYTFTDPAPSLVYLASVQFTYRLQTFRRQITKAGGGDNFPRYLALDEANTLAASVPGLSNFLAATSSGQWNAIAVGTRDIDRAFRYQGRKYLPTQAMEFPRAAYESSSYAGWRGAPVIGPDVSGAMGADVVWDWDSTLNVAIVPANVKIATLYQADFALGGGRRQLLNKAAGGKTSVKIGSGAETYDLKAILAATGGVLCPDAAKLMEYYVLRQGRML